jgi:uncharacterized protein YlxP (DUF503 family)
MYFAVVKLTFEEGTGSAEDRKALRSLVEKLRARFKVCAAVCLEEEAAGAASVAVTALGSTAERLTETLDALTEFCETSGFGRIDSEQTLMDHIDAVADFAEARSPS